MLKAKNKYESNLHRRFITRVLIPPFIALLILAVIGLWQLNTILKRQAVDNLRRSATTTANTVERDFSLREKILQQTGAELFTIKSDYTASRTKLDTNRNACRAYVQQKATYRGAPDGVCEPFLSGFANATSLAVLEDEYIKQGEILIHDQDKRINERLAAFKQFFPGTLALLVIDDDKKVVSSAYSAVLQQSTGVFQADAEAALVNPIRGKLAPVENFKLAVFAFQIQGGSVLAAYDTQNENFIRDIWESAPIDRTRALAVLLDNSGNPAYPTLKDNKSFKGYTTGLSRGQVVDVRLDNIEHTVVGASAGASNWLVVVASPTAAVLAPLRDAQLAGVIFIGLFMVGFLWVGTYFIRRTLRNIVSLVSGAIVFGSGRLDYKIALDHADGEFVRLADTMNTMAERIAAAEQLLDEKNKEFISVATHELRAPLTAVIGHLSLFKELHGQKLDTKAEYLIDQAYYGTTRLRDLVNDMLNVARLESGRSEFALSPVPIKAVIDDVISTMEVVAKMAQVNLLYKDTHATDVLADDQRLRVIVNNLVSNAIKYNRPKGNVTVSHERRDTQLVTTIEDNGLGIPEDQKAHVFEKFFRVEHDDRKGVTGTGLGMYITKEYIEQMQGQIWLESSQGQGTKFSFSLPIVTLKPKLRTKLKKFVKRKPKNKAK